MAFRKSAGGDKKTPAKEKATPKKGGPQKAVNFEDDDDLDVDDKDLEFEEDSDLDEAEDEEFDDEDLDDEDLDDEELGDSEEEVKGAKPAAQKTPGKKEQAKSPSKRKVDEDAGPQAKRVRLEDYLPASQVVDYKERDSRTLHLSKFPANAQLKDVKALCKGAELRGSTGKPLKHVYAEYKSVQDAQEALKTLKDAKIHGAVVDVRYMGGAASDRQLSDTILDVRNIPSTCKKITVMHLFPTAKVTNWHSGYAQLRFKSSEDLVEAVKNPKCREIEDDDLQFALAFAPKKKSKAKDKKTVAATSPKGPKTFKAVGTKGGAAADSPLPKQSKSTPKQSKNTPRARRSAGKKQAA